MSPFVVHRFEIVDVDHEQGRCGASFMPGTERILEECVSNPAVEDAGKGVNVGFFGDLSPGTQEVTVFTAREQEEGEYEQGTVAEHRYEHNDTGNPVACFFYPVNVALNIIEIVSHGDNPVVPGVERCVGDFFTNVTVFHAAEKVGKKDFAVLTHTLEFGQIRGVSGDVGGCGIKKGAFEIAEIGVDTAGRVIRAAGPVMDFVYPDISAVFILLLIDYFSYGGNRALVDPFAADPDGQGKAVPGSGL